MDHMVTAVIGGQERVLNYSIAVMFDMTDRFGSLQKALEMIEAGGMQGFEAVRWFAIEMANDGELCRRAMGHTPGTMVNDADISLRMSPCEFERLTSAVVEAITCGYHREEHDSNEEVDLGLAELEAKK